MTNVRPLYESAHDLSAEARVAEAVGRAWDCRVIKLKRAYAVDYAMLTEKKCRALAEIKVRSYSMDDFERLGGFMLSLHKWASANALATAADVPFLLVVEAAGEIYWHKSTGEHDGVSFGGRTDRNDAQDVEPVVLLLPQRFKRLR